MCTIKFKFSQVHILSEDFKKHLMHGNRISKKDISTYQSSFGALQYPDQEDIVRIPGLTELDELTKFGISESPRVRSPAH